MRFSSIMVSQFTDDEVSQALRVEGYQNHPIVAVMGRYEPQIRDFSLAYHSLAPQDGHEFARNNLGFFVDAVLEAGEFTLNPLEIIAIWSKVRDMELPKYDTARYLSLGYAAIPLDTAIWGGVQRFYLQNDSFPKSVTGRQDDLGIISQRLEQVSESVEKILEYANGFEGGMSAFVAAIKSGDTKTANEMLRIQEERLKKPEMVFFQSISENFSVGVMPVKLYVDELLQK